METVSDSLKMYECRILLILMVVIITDSDDLGRLLSILFEVFILKFNGECGSFFVKSDEEIFNYRHSSSPSPIISGNLSK